MNIRYPIYEGVYRILTNYWTLLFYELRINLLNISLICSLARYLNIIRWI